MLRVPITYGTRPGWVYVRGLRGDDEESVESTDTLSAIALLDRLLIDAPGAMVRPGAAQALPAADRDRVLAALYLHEVGAQVASSAVCPGCKTVFDLDFDLRALMASLDEARAMVARDADGLYALDDGTRFCLPSGADELIAAGAAEPVEALVARCRLAGPGSADEIAAAME